jgi:hypothetical protein
MAEADFRKDGMSMKSWNRHDLLCCKVEIIFLPVFTYNHIEDICV